MVSYPVPQFLRVVLRHRSVASSNSTGAFRESRFPRLFMVRRQHEITCMCVYASVAYMCTLGVHLYVFPASSMSFLHGMTLRSVWECDSLNDVGPTCHVDRCRPVHCSRWLLHLFVIFASVYCLAVFVCLCEFLGSTLQQWLFLGHQARLLAFEGWKRLCLKVSVLSALLNKPLLLILNCSSA